MLDRDLLLVVGSVLSVSYTQYDLQKLMAQWKLSQQQALYLELLYNGQFVSGKFCVDQVWLAGMRRAGRSKGEIDFVVNKIVPMMVHELCTRQGKLWEYLLQSRSMLVARQRPTTQYLQNINYLAGE